MIGDFFRVFLMGYCSWNGVPSGTVIIVTFYDWENPERNMVVCELMASLQLLWQLVPGHQHTSTWNHQIIFHYEICYCTYGFYIVLYLLFQGFFVAVNKIVNSTPEVTDPSLTRPCSGWVVTPALDKIMAWRRPDDKPLSEIMMVSLLTHICVTRPQWFNMFTGPSGTKYLLNRQEDILQRSPKYHQYQNMPYYSHPARWNCLPDGIIVFIRIMRIDRQILRHRKWHFVRRDRGFKSKICQEI